MEEKINEYLILIVGIPGSGKTTLSTELALLQPKTTDIRANYKIHIPNYIELKIEDLEKLNTYEKPNLVIFDEAYTIVDSRNAMSDLNKYISYKTFQSRKTITYYIFNAQLKGSIDNRFRELAGIVIKCKATNLGYFYQVYHNIEKRGQRVLKKRNNWIINYNDAEAIYPYFDTREITMSRKVKDIIVKNMSTTSLIEASKKIADKMLKQRDVWSLRAVKGFLLKNKQSIEFAEPVYYQLEEIKTKDKQKQDKKIKQQKIEEENKKIKEEKMKQQDINYYC